MDGVDSGVLADVIGDVLADADHGVAGADALGLGLARKGAIGAERHGERGARQVDHARRGVRSADLEQQLRRIVGRGEDDVGRERLDLRGEVGAQIGIGDHVDLDAAALEDARRRRRRSAG